MKPSVPRNAQLLSAPGRYVAALSIIQKTQLLLALVLAGLLVVLYGVLSLVVSISIASIERDTAAHAVTLMEKELAYQREQIERIAVDYAVWDDTFFFMHGEQPEYVARNLSDATFEANQLDLLILADASGAARYLRVRGPAGDLPAAQQAALADMLIHSAVVDEATSQQDVASGILDLPTWPVVISAHSVLQSDYSGPGAGVLIMGRRLDTDLLTAIEDRLSATVRFHRLEGPHSALVDRALAALQTGAPHVIAPEGDALVHGFALIRDDAARPVLIGEIAQPRTVWAVGRRMIRWTVASLVAAGGIFALVLTLLLNRLVLRRLAQLIVGVRRIGAEGGGPRQVLLDGNDELSQLASTISETLSTVDQQRIYLTALHETAQREIAERAAIEQALQQSARELQEQNAELNAFGHTVAHDLKTPLTAIIGYSQLLQASHRDMDADAIDKDLQTILTASNTMTTIINELMLLSHVRRSDAIPYETLDMASIVDAAISRLAHVIPQAQAQVICPPSWPLALGYAPWVEEVWVNYVSNALKYGGAPPQVVLGADPPSLGFVRFWVRDNGLGIPKEQQDLLFSVFSRLEPARSEGHGLGLSIVSRIVAKLGGTVGVQSAPGEGSTFFFTLPVR